MNTPSQKIKSSTEKIFPESISKSLHSFDIYIYPHNNFNSFASNFCNIFFFNMHNEILIQLTTNLTKQRPTPQPHAHAPLPIKKKSRTTIQRTQIRTPLDPSRVARFCRNFKTSHEFVYKILPRHSDCGERFFPKKFVKVSENFSGSLWKFLLPCWLMDRDFEKLLTSPAWSCENFFWKVC